jgi:hypothetical protein
MTITSKKYCKKDAAYWLYFLNMMAMLDPRTLGEFSRRDSHSERLLEKQPAEARGIWPLLPLEYIGTA